MTIKNLRFAFFFAFFVFAAARVVALEEVVIYGTNPLREQFERMAKILDEWAGCQLCDGGYYTPDAYIEVAGSDNRPDPACEQERTAMRDLMLSLGSTAVRSGQANPISSSRLLMNSPIGDWRYISDPAWEKWEFKADWYVRSPLSGVVVDKGVIVMHFMFNTRTRDAEQLKFKNSVTQGCGKSSA